MRLYSIKDSCDKIKPTSTETSTWQILQKPLVERIGGHRCRIRKSSFDYACGAWGHLKTASVPKILHSVPVSKSWCRNLLDSRTFTPPGGNQRYPLSPNSNNIIRTISKGKLSYGSQHVECVGESGRIDGNILPAVLTLDEYHIEVRQESFLLRNNEMESQSEHVKLPRTCTPTQAFCETQTGTYLWTPPSPQCDFEIVTTFNPRQEGSLLIDEISKVLINATERVSFPACGNREIFRTTYDQIYVMKGGEAIPGVRHLDPADVQMDAMVSSIASYTMFEAEKKIYAMTSSWQHSVCREKYTQEVDSPKRVAPGLFSLRRGDVLYTFKCPQQTAEILEADRCYTDIPLAGPEKLFVDPVSRTTKTHSAIIPCSKRLPMKVKTTTGWIELAPHIRRTTPPRESFPADDVIEEHEDLSQAGVYTRAELADWEALLAFPAYRDALVGEISLGSCRYNKDCSYPAIATAGSPAYDLRKLVDEEVADLNPLGSVREWIITHGAMLSALVLVLTALQWSMYVVLIVTALIREGPSQALAIAGIIFCSAPQTYGRVQRRRARLAQREAEEQRLMFPLQQPTAPHLQ